MAITKMMHIKERKGGNKSAGLAKALKYIVNPEKTYGGTLTCGYNVSYDGDWKVTYEEMLATKIAYEREAGRQGYHFVISFPPTEDVSPELAMQITQEFLEEYLGDRYEALYAVHTDKKHMHSHIVFNSVSVLDGMMYHYSNGGWRKEIQPIVNDLCEKYNLSMLELSSNGFDKHYENISREELLMMGRRLTRADWEEERRGHHTWAEFAAVDIDRLLPECTSFEDLVNKLTDLGWEVKWKTKDGSRPLKHFALRPPVYASSDTDEHKTRWIRIGKRYGYGYTKEGIELRIKKKIYDLVTLEKPKFDKRPKTPRIIRSEFPEGEYKRTLTEFQKKYLAQLYRTGKMKYISAGIIPEKERVKCVSISEMQREVNYILMHKLTDVSAIKGHIEVLEFGIYKAKLYGISSVVNRLNRELVICRGICFSFEKQGVVV